MIKLFDILHVLRYYFLSFFKFDDGNSFLHGGGDWTNVIIPGDSQRTRYYYIIKIVITCFCAI